MKNMRLLVADDAAMIRRAVVHVIEDCCHGVEVVGEAKDYSDLFRMTQVLEPDVVLVDLNMPSETDLGADNIRVAMHSVYLIAMSAWFDEPAKTRALDCGAMELLDKSSLAATLAPAMERCSMRSKAAARYAGPRY